MRHPKSTFQSTESELFCFRPNGDLAVRVATLHVLLRRRVHNIALALLLSLVEIQRVLFRLAPARASHRGASCPPDEDFE